MSDRDHLAAPVSRAVAGPLAGLGLIAALGWGVYSHIKSAHATTALAAERQSIVPELRVLRVHPAADPLSLDLPGEIAAFETAAIGARASGYVETRLVDIGSVVKRGQVLAIIAAPELSAELAHAQASRAQARANLDLAQITARRSGNLVSDGAVSKQNFDADRITSSARSADRQAAEASYAETAQRQAYTAITAPFDGVVTERHVEVGDLARADTNTPLFVIARTDKLRVRVHVPQDASRAIAKGVQASLTLPERPGLRVEGTVARTGQALEQDSRMLPVEIDLDNTDGRLNAGLYTMVHFSLPRTEHIILVPAEAVSYDATGLSIQTVNPDNTITIRPVSVGRDFGAEIEVISGIADDARIVVHPVSSLQNGSRITVQGDSRKGA